MIIYVFQVFNNILRNSSENHTEKSTHVFNEQYLTIQIRLYLQ